MTPFKKALSLAINSKDEAELANVAQKLNLSFATMKALAELGQPDAPPDRNAFFLSALLNRHYPNFNPLRLALFSAESGLESAVILEMASLLELSNPSLEKAFKSMEKLQIAGALGL